MKTFLINEQYKKTTKGGKWLCRVFLIEKSQAKKWYLPSWNTCLYDITRRVAELWNREKQFDWLVLTIHYWSWTGMSVIEEILKVNWGNDINIVDVSIF